MTAARKIDGFSTSPYWRESIVKHTVKFFTCIIIILFSTFPASCGKVENTLGQTNTSSATEVVNSQKGSTEPLRKPIFEDIYSNSKYTVTGDPSSIASGWVKSWLEENYGDENAEVECKYRTAYEGFSDNFQISPILYSVKLSSEKTIEGAQKQQDGTYTFDMLAITVAENDKYTLSGFIGPDKFNEKDAMEAAYKVVAKDPRYSSKLKSSPEVNLPKEFTQVSMDLVSGGREAIGAWTRVLPGNIVASLCRDSLGQEGQYSLGVSLFDLKAGKNSAYMEIGEYSLRYIKARDGKIEIYAMDNDNIDSELFIIDSKGNMSKQKLSSDKDNVLYSPDGSKYAYSSKGNLYIVDKSDSMPKLIGTGNDTDTTKWASYYPYAWVDNSRFVYGINGYEWSNGCGIYDAASGKDTTFKNIDPNASPAALINGKLYITKGIMDAEVDPYVIDLNDPQYSYRKLFKDKSFTISSNMDSYGFSPDGTKMAVLKTPVGQNGKNTLYICSTGDGSILKSFEFQVSYCRPQYLDFFENGRIAIYSEKYALSPDYMYLVDIR